MTPEPKAFPGRAGWDAMVSVSYGSLQPDSPHVEASAWQKANVWYVILIEATRQGFARRRAQIAIATDGFVAPGVVDESFGDQTPHALDEPRLAKLTAFLEEGRVTARVPGLAAAVVQGGKIVYAKGFGVKALGDPDAVTPSTLFRIASISKPLTSLLVASLVDDEKLDWDTRAVDLLPSFALGDPDLTASVTVRHLLCACAGIPYDNLGNEFVFATTTPEKLLLRMRQLRPTTKFGETFQYSNPMVAAGGYIAAHVAEPKRGV